MPTLSSWNSAMKKEKFTIFVASYDRIAYPFFLFMVKIPHVAGLEISESEASIDPS